MSQNNRVEAQNSLKSRYHKEEAQAREYIGWGIDSLFSAAPA